MPKFAVLFEAKVGSSGLEGLGGGDCLTMAIFEAANEDQARATVVVAGAALKKVIPSVERKLRPIAVVELDGVEIMREQERAKPKIVEPIAERCEICRINFATVDAYVQHVDERHRGR